MGITKKLFILILLLIFLSNSGCILTNNAIEKEIDALEIESNTPLGYLYHNKFFYLDEVLDFDELLKNEKIKASFEDVFCVTDNNIWFLYSTEITGIGEKWHLATVTMTGKDFCLRYESIFCSSDDSDTSYRKSLESIDYSEMNGFYVNDKIILTDKNKLVEINILSNEIIEYSYKNYKFLESTVYIDIQPQQLVFHGKEKKRIIDFTEASKMSKGFDQIAQFSKYKIYDGTYSMDSFFDKVQFCNGKYYIYGRILNWHGETHMVIFEYDFYNDCLSYILSLKTYDVASHCLFIVPINQMTVRNH